MDGKGYRCSEHHPHTSESAPQGREGREGLRNQNNNVRIVTLPEVGDNEEYKQKMMPGRVEREYLQHREASQWPSEDHQQDQLEYHTREGLLR